MSRRFLGSVLVTFGLALLVVAPNALATPRASVTAFPLPHGDSRPYDIVAGPDGNLWFTESTNDAIGKITPDGTITEYPLHVPAQDDRPYGIAVGADGALWFTERLSDKIGRLDPTTGHFQEFYTSARNRSRGESRQCPTGRSGSPRRTSTTSASSSRTGRSSSTR